ncbi:hypothetical protein MVEN_01135400 [Mycena venus]|uniref:C2H2-type domain-containing protein n=1 Tax=Mycena venus TaxID=2733690 RepID=A0A8H7D025_9AGAR|nr:hypothetical protein MVEN_01135400 [Mycena venus]
MHLTSARDMAPAVQQTANGQEEHGDEFFVYHLPPWSNTVGPNNARPFPSQGYYGPHVLIRLLFAKQQAPPPSHHGPPSLLSSPLLELADGWRAQRQHGPDAVRPAPVPASRTEQMCDSHGVEQHLPNQSYNCAGGSGVQRSYGTNAAHEYQQVQQFESTPSPTSPTSPWDINAHADARASSLSPALSHPTSHSHPPHSPSMHHIPHPLTHAHSHSGTDNSHAHAHSHPRGVNPRYVLPSSKHAPEGGSNSVRSSPVHSPLPNGPALPDGEDNTSQYTACFWGYPATTINGSRSSPDGSASPSAEQEADLDADGDPDTDADPDDADAGRSDSESIDNENESDSDGEFLPPDVRRRARILVGGVGTRHAPYAYGLTLNTSASKGMTRSYGRREWYESVMVPSHDYLDAGSDPNVSGYLHDGMVGGSPRRPRPQRSIALPVSIPVPNLTKKCRGRKVPTVQSMYGCQGDFAWHSTHISPASPSLPVSDKFFSGHIPSNVNAVAARPYVCKVSGCGKCFARGEHLKRHVRSIHTHEKPHKCPYPGCAKDFSRHDNMGQHMRVHKDFVGGV